MKKYTFQFWLAIILSLSLRCTSEQPHNQDIYNKIISQRRVLIGKDFSIVSHLIDTIDYRQRLYYIFNGFDCESCILNGFELIKNENIKALRRKAIVIGITPNPNPVQLLTEYNDYIFIDKSDVIRRQLKYFFTPIFILVDSQGKIMDVFYPGFETGSSTQLKFINNCINNELTNKLKNNEKDN